MWTPCSRQNVRTRFKVGNIVRPAGVSSGAPGATKSFSMSTIMSAVLWGSTRSIWYGIGYLLSEKTHIVYRRERLIILLVMSPRQAAGNEPVYQKDRYS